MEKTGIMRAPGEDSRDLCLPRLVRALLQNGSDSERSNGLVAFAASSSQSPVWEQRFCRGLALYIADEVVECLGEPPSQLAGDAAWVFGFYHQCSVSKVMKSSTHCVALLALCLLPTSLAT